VSYNSFFWDIFVIFYFHAIHVNIISRLDAIYDIKAIDPPTPLALTYMVLQSLQGMVSSRLSCIVICYITFFPHTEIVITAEFIGLLPTQIQRI
jgi:hypothetical protein